MSVVKEVDGGHSHGREVSGVTMIEVLLFWFTFLLPFLSICHTHKGARGSLPSCILPESLQLPETEPQIQDPGAPSTFLSVTVELY